MTVVSLEYHMPTQMAFKFADWDVDGPASVWESVNTRGWSATPFTGTDRLAFVGRNSAQHSWFKLEMRCPYLVTATGDARDVPFAVVGQFANESPTKIFQVLRDQARIWLDDHVESTIKSVLRLETFTKWLSWLSQQELTDASVIRDVMIVAPALSEKAYWNRNVLAWVGLLATIGCALGAASLLWLTRLPPIATSHPSDTCRPELRWAIEDTSLDAERGAADITIIKEALNKANAQLAQVEATAAPKKDTLSYKVESLSHQVDTLRAAVGIIAAAEARLQSQSPKDRPPLSKECKAWLSQ